MNANLSYLGFVLLVFAFFNSIFVCGFFKTAYKFAKPFVKFIIAAFAAVGIGETLFHIPGFEAINAFGFEHIWVQIGIFVAGFTAYLLMTVCSVSRAIKHFEKIDL